MAGSTRQLELASKRVLVTGASRGIGRALAVGFAARGARVALAARSTTARPGRLAGTLEETAASVSAAGGEALIVPTDLTDDASVERLAVRVKEAFGGVDLLINNAGTSTWGNLLDLPVRRWDIVMAVNLRAPYLLMKAFAPGMVTQGYGRIVNISSAAARATGAGRLSYTVSKAALDALSRGLAEELRGTRVTVNALDLELFIESEGGRSVFPEIAQWHPPEVVVDALLWIVAQGDDFTGHAVTMAELGQTGAFDWSASAPERQRERGE